MITINYQIKDNQFEAHYKDSNGFLIKFGPYPTKEIMEASLNEYALLIKEVYKLKEFQTIH